MVSTAALIIASCRSDGGAPSAPSSSSVPPVSSSTSLAVSLPPSSIAPASTVVATTTTAVPAALTPSGAWDAVPALPLSPRHGALVVAVGDELLVVGGRSGKGAGPFGDLTDGAVLDSYGTRWRRIHDAPVPVGAESAAAVWFGGLYVTTGTTMLEYDVTHDEWRTLPPAPSHRAYARLLAGDAELFLVGGVDAAHVTNPSADGPLVPAPAAYAPATRSWRELAGPGWPGAVSVADAAWNGTSLLVAVGPVDNGDGAAPKAPASPVVLLDPVSGATKPLPATPLPVFGVHVTLDDGAVLLFDQESAVWRLPPEGTAWERFTVVPSAGQTAVVDAWRFVGHLVVDTGPGTNGRSIAYRQASGAWSELGSPIDSGDTRLVQTDSGYLFATDGVTTARLKAFADRTDGVELCTAAQLEADALDGTHIEVTNVGATPCALDGQRPATVDFHVATDLWERAGASAFLRLPVDGDGGYLRPGGTALMEVVPGLYAGVDCPFAHRSYEGMRFSAPGDGELVPVAITTTVPCPDLTALVARAAG